MKVFHYHFGKDGGAERFFTHLVNALASSGVEQTSIIRPGRIWRKDIEGATRIIESHFRNFSFDRLLLPLKAARMARKERPDVLMAWAQRASELMPAYDGCIKIARLGDYPTRLSYFRNIDVIVCNTPGIAAHVKAMGWTRGIEVISNFTAPERVAPVARASVDTPENAFVVSTMGRFVPRKGFDVLLRAMAELPDAYLWLMGNGEEEANLRALAQQLGVVDRVRFLGWQADPRPYVAASDCFAMSSSHEPLGNVILEAWAQEVPVVSTRSEGPMWFMQDGVNGLMVDIGDRRGFARAFARIREDGALRRRLVEGGSSTLQERFSRAAVVEAYMRLFASGSSASAEQRAAAE